MGDIITQVHGHTLSDWPFFQGDDDDFWTGEILTLSVTRKVKNIQETLNETVQLMRQDDPLDIITFNVRGQTTVCSKSVAEGV